MSCIVDLIAKDNDVIIYRKELNAITKKVTATLLLQQMIYWYSKSSNGTFYKFIEPCKNDAYSEGDSWCEELGFTKKEFMSAYQILEDLGIVSKKINMSRITFYTLNIEHLSKLLNGIYVSDKRSLMQVTKGHLDKDQALETETTTEKKIGSYEPKGIQAKIYSGQPVAEEDLIFEKMAKRRDTANLISMGLGVDAQTAAELAYCFMMARDITIPESKIKGQRKAIRELLEMKVSPENVERAVSDLVSKGMTVVDLFSIIKTATDLANKAPEDIQPKRSHGL